jgi:hypothetical protein
MKLSGITVGLGITTEINGTYIKPNAAVNIEFEGEEYKDKEFVQKTWDQAWDALSREIERVIKAYADSSGGVVNIAPKDSFSDKA